MLVTEEDRKIRIKDVFCRYLKILQNREFKKKKVAFLNRSLEIKAKFYKFAKAEIVLFEQVVSSTFVLQKTLPYYFIHFRSLFFKLNKIKCKIFKFVTVY